MFYVLDGVLSVSLGDDTHQIGPGSFFCVPPEVVHTFSNTGDSPARLLNFNTPAGWEKYMRDLAEAAKAGPLTPASDPAVGPVDRTHDLHLLDSARAV
jgi:oxalate decarboxylase/phosphoglucose isomerase-like protein (cupin superfamily)